MTAVIRADSLARRFGTIQALDGITFSVQEGEVFGLLGPNGAGKTTTVRLLNGVLAPSGGEARVLGLDPVTQGPELRRRTGVLTETPALYERLSARENLKIFGNLYGVPSGRLAARVEELLELFDLAARADDRAGGFSKGMKQRLALSRTLLHDPPLLFLDEPTAGLDPEAARQVIELVQDLSHREGRTILLCTHNLDEAQRLCTRVAVMGRGKLLANGTLEELSRTLWQGIWLDVEFRGGIDPAIVAAARELEGVLQVQVVDGCLYARLESREEIPALVAMLAARGLSIFRVNPRQHTLEDIYFRLQGEGQEATR